MQDCCTSAMSCFKQRWWYRGKNYRLDFYFVVSKVSFLNTIFNVFSFITIYNAFNNKYFINMLFNYIDKSKKTNIDNYIIRAIKGTRRKCIREVNVRMFQRKRYRYLWQWIDVIVISGREQCVSFTLFTVWLIPVIFIIDQSLYPFTPGPDNQ